MHRSKRPNLATLTTLVSASLLIASVAMAGKAEREYMKEIVKPAVAAAEAAYKSSCGCELKIWMDPKFKTKDELGVIRSTANSVEKGVTKQCSDKESKQIVCKMKTLRIAKDKDTKFTFSGSTGTAASDGTLYLSWDQMMEKVDP